MQPLGLTPGCLYLIFRLFQDLSSISSSLLRGNELTFHLLQFGADLLNGAHPVGDERPHTLSHLQPLEKDVSLVHQVA